MKVAVFSTKSYDRHFLDIANAGHGHELRYFDHRLTVETCALARGMDAVCIFVNDVLDRATIERLAAEGIRLVALRCAGFNHVDLAAAAEHGVTVVRVPAYSPHAVAEHAVGLILTLNRRFHRAFNRTREGNFTLDGLLGFDLHEKTVGVVGTGQIGAITAQILSGFGCHLLGHDPSPNDQCRAMGMKYVSLEELFSGSDIVTLHCPLTPQTHHLIDAVAMEKMKEGVMLINTSRGALVDTKAVIAALKSGRIGYLGLDVYEEEAHLFFEDLSGQIIQDDVFARLLTFPNVLVTSHQGFFTEEAITRIAETTVHNLTCFARDEASGNELGPERIRP